MSKKNKKHINPTLIKFAKDFIDIITPYKYKDSSNIGSGHYCFIFSLKDVKRTEIENLFNELLIKYGFNTLNSNVPSPWISDMGLNFGISSVVDTKIKPFQEVQFFVHFSDAALQASRIL